MAEVTEDIKVEWKSSNPDVISESGHVVRPQRDTDVTMTAKIYSGGEEVTLSYKVHVIAKSSLSEEDIEDYCIEDLDEKNKNDEDYEVKINDYGYLQRVYGKYSDVKVDSYESALYSLYNVKSAMGISDPLTELIPELAYADEYGQTYHFVQVIDGVNTYENRVIVSTDSAGNVVFLDSDYFPVEGGVEVTPSISYKKAVSLIQDKFTGMTVHNGQQEEACFINYYGQVDLAWKISVVLTQKEQEYEAGSYLFLVSAQDGQILCHEGLQDNIFGKAYEREEKVENQIDLFQEKRTIYITKKTQNNLFQKDKVTYLLQDKRYNFNVQNGTIDEKVKDLSEIESSERSTRNQWSAKQVSAMYHFREIHDFYQRTFARSGYRNDNFRTTLNIYLCDNYKDNSSWNREGAYVLLGHGSGGLIKVIAENGKVVETDKRMKSKSISYAASKDLLCHEFTHAVMRASASGLGERGREGAIGEAYADIASCVMRAASDKVKWQIGKDVMQDLPLRDVFNPTLCHCAEKVGGDYYMNPNDYALDKGGTHVNSTIISHAFYQMTKKVNKNNLSQKTLYKIWYNSMYELKSGADFYEVRRLFTNGAKRICEARELGTWKRIINSSFDMVNVKKSNCDMSTRERNRSDKKRYSEKYFHKDIRLSGQVVEADDDIMTGNNKALRGVEVGIFDLDEEELGGRETTDKKGDYSVVSTIADGYCLYFQKEGYLEDTLYLSDINELIQNEYYCDRMELIPEQYDGIGGAAGKLLDAATLKGVPDAQLIVRDGMNNIYSDSIDTIYTDEKGNYSLEGLHAGNYCLEVTGLQEYVSTYFNVKILGGKTVSGQNGYVSGDLDKRQARIVLTWGNMPEDLDAHMTCKLSSGGEGHVYFKRLKFSAKGKVIYALDVDEILGYGPETMTIYHRKAGTYQYYIHQYSDEGQLQNSNACVKVYYAGKSYPSYTFHVPDGVGWYWNVFRLNGATGRLTPVNKIASRPMT